MGSASSSPRLRNQILCPGSTNQSLDISFFELDALSSGNTAACLGDPAKKSRIVLKAILKPVILRRESDKHPGRPAVSCDHDLLLLRITEVPGKIVFSFVERNPFSLPRLSQPVCGPFFRWDRKNMNFGIHHIVENPYAAHTQSEVRPRDTTETLDARLGGLGRPDSQVAQWRHAPQPEGSR
jgi:hypothetical protein